MKSLTYIIADDDPLYREISLQHLQLVPNLQCLAVCDSAVAANAELQLHFPDVLILDVEMPGLSGIQLAKSLKQLPLIIFISSHSHYAADAFEVDAIDYLVKPVAPERLIRAIEKARALLEMKQFIQPQEAFKTGGDDSFFIRDKNAFVRINHADVLYIQSLGDFVNIFLQNGEKKIALVSMKNLEQQLPAGPFIRISRTHMVNKNRINSIDSNTISLDKIQLHIGSTYTEAVLQAVIGNTAIKRFI
ncbi:MAG: LytTR family DNA-binding domain-containing protein [Ferruginibacter sp.]